MGETNPVKPAEITTFLMFEGKAEEAMNFYLSLFADSELLSISRYGAEGPGAEGSVVTATFRLNAQTIMCSDSNVKHAFGFTPATSFFVTCHTEQEVDTLFEKLADGGFIAMPLAAYPFSPKFAWVTDRFGVSWQLSLAAD